MKKMTKKIFILWNIYFAKKNVKLARKEKLQEKVEQDKNCLRKMHLVKKNLLSSQKNIRKEKLRKM